MGVQPAPPPPGPALLCSLLISVQRNWAESAAGSVHHPPGPRRVPTARLQGVRAGRLTAAPVPRHPGAYAVCPVAPAAPPRAAAPSAKPWRPPQPSGPPGARVRPSCLALARVSLLVCRKERPPPDTPWVEGPRAWGAAGLTVLATAPSCCVPSRNQMMVAAGLALKARQVRLCGVPACSRSTGPPSILVSSGGTAGRAEPSWGGAGRAPARCRPCRCSQPLAAGGLPSLTITVPLAPGGFGPGHQHRPLAPPAPVRAQPARRTGGLASTRGSLGPGPWAPGAEERPPASHPVGPVPGLAPSHLQASTPCTPGLPHPPPGDTAIPTSG